MEGGFELRQWASNITKVIRHFPAELKSNSGEIWLTQVTANPQEKALGKIWQCGSDTLMYKLYQREEGHITMRKVKVKSCSKETDLHCLFGALSCINRSPARRRLEERTDSGYLPICVLFLLGCILILADTGSL